MPKFDDFDDDDNDIRDPGFRSKLGNLSNEPDGDDDDDDNDDDSGNVEAREEDVTVDNTDDQNPVVTRREKRAERGKMIDRLNRLEVENAELKGKVSVIERTGERDKTDEVNPDDEYEREFNKLQDEAGEAYRNYQSLGAKATKEDLDKYNKRVRDIDMKKHKLTVRTYGNNGGNAQDVRAQLIREEFADVYSNQNAVTYAEGYYRMKQAEGRQDSKELLDESMNAARSRFGLRKTGGRPTESMKQKFSGQRDGSASSSGQSSGGGGSIIMTKELRAIARATYRGKSDEEAFKLWANSEAGREYMKMSRSQ